MAELEALKKRRSIIKGLATKLSNYVGLLKDDKLYDIDELKTRMKRMEEHLKEFTSVENNILQSQPDEKSDAMEFEETYYHVVSKLSRHIRIYNMKTQSTSVAPMGGEDDTLNTSTHKSSLVEVKLPKVNVPCFAGDYTEWTSFFDLYTKAIHETGLTPAQKFQYLKGYLKGDAADLLKHFTINDVNYVEALQLLKERYDRQNFTVNVYIHKFIDQPSITSANSSNVRLMLNTSESVLRGLKALGEEADTRDPWLIHLLVNKIDDESKRQWVQYITNNNINFPTMVQFLKFLSGRADSLESLKAYVKKPLQKNMLTKNLVADVKELKSLNIKNCPVCNATDHFLHECDQFLKKNIDDRRLYVKQAGRCFNCLSSKHGVYKCTNRHRCRECHRKHHTILHQDQAGLNVNSNNISSCVAKQFTQTDDSTSSANNSNNIGFTSSHSANIHIHTLLPTAIVKIRSNNGTWEECRIMLDSGSQASFITETCVRRLRLRKRNTHVVIRGLGDSESGAARGKVRIEITNRFSQLNSTKDNVFIDAFIFSKITSHTPPQRVDISNWDHLHNLKLADPNYFIPGEVDALIGSDLFFEILLPHKIRRSLSEPIAFNSIFGFIIAGPVNNSANEEDEFDCLNSVTELTLHVNVDELLLKFWFIEDVVCTKIRSEEEEFAEMEFNSHVQRTEEGRYMVKLPFKSNPEQLGDSYPIALARLYAMERKFRQCEDFYKLYKEFMSEYEFMGHMQEAPQHPPTGYYLPHHGVLKNDSKTSKIRVVFDGSANPKNGKCLNQLLAIGPIVQDSLFSIILRFRKHKVAMSSDVEKMYRQIVMNPEDRKYQMILWRHDTNSPIKTYELCTVTYGLSSSSYQATQTLIQVGRDSTNCSDDVRKIIDRDFYVDDLLTGASSLEEAIRIKQELSEVLNQAGFNLRKWSSNYDALLPNINDDNEKQPKSIDEYSTTVKVLGLYWNPKTDCFGIKVSLNANPKYTKRDVLSEASRIFDPLGWLAPIVVKVKVFFQSLWKENLQWDDALSNTLRESWIETRNDLSRLEALSIPRWVQVDKHSIEIHGFSDASQLAYAAVVYSRVTLDSGDVIVKLLCSKTKVAPVNTISIPRLELCGAVLLARLMKTVMQSIGNEIEEYVAWSDSTIVLNWLSCHPSNWKCFVANRTSEILSTLDFSRWKHVRSYDNPADLASRGMMVTKFINCDLWWNGPSWLRLSEDMWPQNEFVPEETTEELKNNPTRALNSRIDENMVSMIAERCSSFEKLVETFCYVFRFIRNSRKVGERIYGSITREERVEAHEFIYLNIQQQSFQHEISSLVKSNEVSASSGLKSLCPFIDKRSLMRVGGRLQNALVSFETKHPIILPYESIVTKLIVRDAHHKFKHANVSLLVNLLKQQYWIVKCRHIAKRIVHECVRCTIWNARAREQLMGQLPPHRVRYERPFLKVGVDYAGPMKTHLRKGRGQKVYKSYVAVFVCLSTRAVHLELVTELTTDCFVAALKRFIGRRGCCSDLFCDNATNFKGTSNQMKEMQQFLESNKNLFSQFLSRQFINWHFIPPAAPHFGGIWEAAVKSAKYHMHRVVGETILTIEEISTLLVEIEALLNSRPIGTYSDNDIDILTPSHFILGQPIRLLPDFNNVSNIKIDDRWKHIQQMKIHFWQRWHVEYLNSLQQRKKWINQHPSLKIDDVVVIIEANVPPGCWLLGKIINVYPGKDGLIRVVDVKTESGIFQRPITKICKLPVESTIQGGRDVEPPVQAQYFSNN